MTENEREEQTVQQIKDGLDKMDAWFPVYTPDLNWFGRQVEAEKKRVRLKLLKELSMFWAAAIFVLAAVIALVKQQPVYLLYIQLIGVVLLPLALIFEKRKRVDANGEQ